MNIAILGFGTIGSGVYEIIEHATTPETKALHVTHILICLLYTSKIVFISTSCTKV